MLAAVVGLWGYAAITDVAALRGRDWPGDSPRGRTSEVVRASTLRPTLAPIIGGAAILYCLAVQWLFVARALPMDRYFVIGDSDMGLFLQKTPALMLVMPLMALAIVIGLEAFVRRTVSSPQPALSRVPYLQYRTLRVWMGQSFAGISYLETGSSCYSS